MVDLGGGVVCFYHIKVGNSWQRGAAGLLDGHGVMVSHRVGPMFGTMVISMVGMPWCSSTLKMDQWLMDVMVFEARA
jgi:hypothetical protein